MTARPDRVDEVIAAWRAELPDVLGPTSELTKRIMLLGADLAEVTRRVLSEQGLTTAEFDVLVSLRRGGAPYRMKPVELSRALLLSTGGTSNVLNQLVARGLVEREPDPDDGRGTQIRLTRDGVSAAEAALRANTRAHDDMWSGVPPTVVSAAARALREVFAAVDAGRKPAAPPVRARRTRTMS